MRLLAFLLVVAASGVACAAPAELPAKWLLVSDIHFDPLAQPALIAKLIERGATEWPAVLADAQGMLPAYGDETNYALLESGLKAMRREAHEPPVVVIAGDLLPHHFHEKFEAAAPRGADFEAFAEKTIDFLVYDLEQAFPRAQFVLALGNNDSACGDYCVEPGGAFLTHAAAAWAPLVNRGGRAPDFAKSFAAGGLYTATLPGPGSPQVVVLDSVLWSAHHSGDARPGAAELEVLRTTLSAHAAPWRWFVAHVPPGFDAFTSAKRGEPVSFLEAKAGATLASLLTSPTATGATMITGHSHHASFQVVSSGGRALPLISVPAVSPIFKQNPAFAVAELDPGSGVVSAVTTYVLPLDKPGAGWVEETACRRGPDDVPSLTSYQAALTQPGKAEATYLGCFATQSSAGAVPEKDWPWYVCADTAQTRESYCLCLATQQAARGCR